MRQVSSPHRVKLKVRMQHTANAVVQLQHRIRPEISVYILKYRRHLVHREYLYLKPYKAQQTYNNSSNHNHSQFLKVQ